MNTVTLILILAAGVFCLTVGVVLFRAKKKKA